MPDRFDVAIVGARCAGSPLAIQLARSGLRVALIDRAAFPSDTPSTHFFQAEGVASLHRLGVLSQLQATGAPFIERAHFRLNDIRLELPWPARPDDEGPAMSVRRPVLDSVLVEAAQEAGAELRASTKVIGLVEEGDRVCGVRTRARGREDVIRAALVVGADGRGSTIGDAVGARLYNVARSERFVYWGYYEGTRSEGPPAVWIQRWDDEFMIGFPCDSGLFLVGVGPPMARLAEFTADPERSFAGHVARCQPLAEIVNMAGVRRVGRLHRMTRFDGYLRESAGPGWALVGDAGHFKDPSPAQGISDALRQADRLAPVILAGLEGSCPLDDALRAWWRWRDEDAAEHYVFATVLGRAGRVPAVFAEATRQMMTTPDRAARLLDIFNHRAMPSQVMTPAVIGAATWTLMSSGASPRLQVLGEVARLAADECRRRRWNRHPRYADTSQVLDRYPASDLPTILGSEAV